MSYYVILNLEGFKRGIPTTVYYVYNKRTGQVQITDVCLRYDFIHNDILYPYGTSLFDMDIFEGRDEEIKSLAKEEVDDIRSCQFLKFQ